MMTSFSENILNLQQPLFSFLLRSFFYAMLIIKESKKQISLNSNKIIDNNRLVIRLFPSLHKKY